jgi:hypothetical protein
MPAVSVAGESDQAGARMLFVEGRKLADAGNYVEACVRFEESFRLDPGVGTDFNLADCQEHIGRTASAWTRFLDVASATKAAGQTERERAALARAAALEPKLARLVVVVTSALPGLIVARDGETMGATSWGISVPIDSGEHLVEAAAPGKKKWAQRTTVPAGPITFVVSVPALEDISPDQASSAAATGGSPAPQPSLRIEPTSKASIPIVAFGTLGALGLAAGLVFALKVQSENGEAKGLCAANLCASVDEKNRYDTLVSDAHRDRAVAFISAGIGGAALLTAAYLWWRPERSPSRRLSNARFSASPLIGVPGARVEVTW